MSDFGPAVRVLLDHEKGYVFAKGDRGGPTNWGISLRFMLREWPALFQAGCRLSFVPPVTLEAIHSLTRANATEIYRVCFWDFQRYWRLEDQTVATKVFDAAVNMGPPYKGEVHRGQAHVLAQQAANACGAKLEVDGMLGPLSVAGINALPADGFLLAMRAEMERFYRGLAETQPEKVRFLAGWLSRAAWPGKGGGVA